jgi:hypothetical protein
MSSHTPPLPKTIFYVYITFPDYLPTADNAKLVANCYGSGVALPTSRSDFGEKKFPDANSDFQAKTHTQQI